MRLANKILGKEEEYEEFKEFKNATTSGGGSMRGCSVFLLRVGVLA
jgi:hypothetical protein